LALSERDYDNEEQQPGRPGAAVDPLRVWNTLRRRWHLIVIAGVIGAFAGAAWAKKLVESNYPASGIITWNSGYDYKPEEREAIVESMLFVSNLEEVRKRLKLEPSAKVLAKIFTVAPSQKSNNIVIETQWGSPEGAAQMVNTLIDVFLGWRHQIIVDRLKANAQRYKDAIAEAERRQAAAAQKLDEFRQKSGITDISEEQKAMIAQTALIASQLDAARQQSEVASARLKALSSGGGSAVNDVVSETDRRQAEADRERLPKAQAEFNQAKLNYPDTDPRVRRLEAEISAIQARTKARGTDPNRGRADLEKVAQAAEQRRKTAEAIQLQQRDRLNKLSGVEGQMVALMSETKVAEQALENAKALYASADLESQNPPSEFKVLERAFPAKEALASPRKNIMLGLPIGFALLSLLGIILWSLRRLDVRTPKEAAFWGSVPVVGASTWPRDPDMLSSLMHDLDDYAPHCEGVTLIVGASLDEAHLARRVAEWDGHRMVKSIDDPQRLLAAGQGGSTYPLARPSSAAEQRDRAEREGAAASNMQILTLTGPVPAQALRRAARLADRVMVVVASGKHSIFQLMKIKGRLGRDQGIGILLVGLDKDYAMVRDRVGDIERFWHATRAAQASER
jgi:uncharacterized protein involved in exopolysaccharide biosynthesis